jgi:FlaA1/EpsC-like NDP-sugar epimerase
VITGLREGEKLHEVLRATGEEDQRPIHPKISHATVPVLTEAQLDWPYWSRMWAPGHLVGHFSDTRQSPEGDR